MHILISLLVIAVIGFAAWQGYRRGIVGSVLAVVFIALSVFGANMVANTYSNEFTTMFRPFIGGYLDRIEAEAAETIAPAGMEHFSVTELFQIEPAIEPVLARQVVSYMGVHESRTEEIVQDYLYLRGYGYGVNDAMTTVLVDLFCFLLVFVVAFLAILITLTVIYNVIPLSFRIPHFGRGDDIGGAAAGLVQGVLLVFMAAWLIGYIGIALPESVERAGVLNFFVNNNPMVVFIG